MGLFDFFKTKKEHNRNFQGVGDTPLDTKFTPDNINTLGRRDIFVFGSNLAGHHAGGAARTALNRFGAIWGQGEGLQGNSYAIPTMHGGIETIRPYVEKFIEFTKREKSLTFYVTKIGCGIAGFNIEDIALLFKNAIDLPNVRLPKEFVEAINANQNQFNNFTEIQHRDSLDKTRRNKQDYMPQDALVSNTATELCKENRFANNTNTIPPSIKPSHEVTTHSFGMAKTFADIIIGLNKEKHYTIPEDALTDLGTYLQRFREQGDDIAFLSVRILINILHEPEMFSAGTLNTDYLRTKLFDDHHFENECDKAYDNYCREKLANLVCYLNEFRKYSSAEEVRNDLFSSTNVLQFSHCGPIEGFYYFQMSGATGMNYPVQFFISSIRELWTEITTDGILDADKMRTIMFGNHLNSISELGLEATIAKDYIEDGPCHPEVFFPKKFGTGPVYVKTKNGRYNRSCGEGKGLNRVPDYLEFEIALQILEKDKNYIKKDGFLIPKEDISLPVYHVWEGKIVFSSLEEKIEFLHDIKKRK